MYGFVRNFQNLMYGPDISMYGFVRISFQNLGSHPENNSAVVQIQSKEAGPKLIQNK